MCGKKTSFAPALFYLPLSLLRPRREKAAALFSQYFMQRRKNISAL